MNIITFDIEEWFNVDVISGNFNWDKYEVHIYKNVDLILNALEKRNQKATFFCLGWIARKHPDLLMLIKSAEHEIGCHSDMHKILDHFNINEFRKDTETAIKSIEDVVSEKIILYRAPCFSITENNKWAFEVLIDYGIEIDCSIFPAKRDYGGFQSFASAKPTIISINGNQIKEFPLNTASFMGQPFVFSGGGYFRFYPYWFIRKLMLKNNYVMTYFHPHDFDLYKPVLPRLPIIRKFKSYYGIRGAFAKFERLLDEFVFLSLLDASKLIDWGSASIVKL